ncbi:hypothetical protein GIB67_010331 [Kingdonia uniflora]|uniref:PORR domain-containing protein n=1 Tax=Kingdonia uniflora TaxID=39325 RepID=A0A7J7MA60_9MAGN|nr:hypothetical protein GIB67_010331 [Kingdonia uniflora]
MKNLMKFDSQTLTKILKSPNFIRSKTTSAQYVETRFKDPTFEKLMDNYKHLFKVISIQDLILANTPPFISIDLLSKVSQKFHLNRGALPFLRKFPRIFNVFYDSDKSQPCCKLTDLAVEIARQESEATKTGIPIVVDRLVRLLSMSGSRSIPVRAVFKVWRELGLPDDFEDSVILQNPELFTIRTNPNERNTHILELVDKDCKFRFLSEVENWREKECQKWEGDCEFDRSKIRFAFKHGYPPGMRLSKGFRTKVKEWQSLPYLGPYEVIGKKRKSKEGIKKLEKRAVGIAHEFLSLTTEKMIEVEKISHFRKLFGIDLNIRDLFLDHPGIFYLSTKGYRHMVFLRESYERGCLINPNPVYDIRRKLLDLVLLGRKSLLLDDFDERNVRGSEEAGLRKDIGNW